MDENLKVFKLENKLDFKIYLCELIIAVYKCHNNLKRYLSEIDNRINELGLREDATINICAEEFKDINNKINFESILVLNYIGDLTNTAMSYYKFRKIYNKKKDESMGFELDVLSQDIQQDLQYINESRNWGLHIPESLLHAKHENYKKETQKDPKTAYSFNPIIIGQFEKYEGKWLISLYDEMKNNYEITSKVLQQMKKDYSKIIGESMRIQKENIEVRYLDELEVLKTSFEIQQRKYNK